MTPLFGGKKGSGKTVLMLDIENGSVAAALARITPGHLPQLYGETRISLPLSRSRTSADIAAQVEKAVGMALQTVSAVAAHMRAHEHSKHLGAIDSVAVFLGAPWGTPNLQKSKPDFLPGMREYLRDEIAAYTEAPVSFYIAADAGAFGLLSLQNDGPTLSLSLGGEITELILLQEGGVAAYATMPLGYHTLQRTLKTHAGLTAAEIHSLFSLAHRDTHAGYEPLVAAGRHFGQELYKTAGAIFEQAPAQELIIISHAPVGKWLARALSEQEVLHELFPEGGVVRELGAHALEHVLTMHAPQPDVPLALETLFVDKKFSTIQ